MNLNLAVLHGQEPKEVRCESTLLFKILPDEQLIEILCRHPRCTRGGRAVVYHRIDFDGNEVETVSYKNPR